MNATIFLVTVSVLCLTFAGVVNLVIDSFSSQGFLGHSRV